MYQLGAGHSPAGALPPAPSGFGLREVLYVLGKWKLIIILVVVGAVGTAGVFTTFVLPKVYRASATVDVTQILAPQSGGGQGAGQAGAATLQGVVTQATSQPTATLPTLLWEITSPATLQAASQLLGTGGPSAGAMGGMISASEIAGTDLISIAATSHDPHEAAAVANAVAQAFATSETTATSGHVGQGLTLLQQEAATVKSQLDAATAALATAQEQPGAAPSTQSQITSDNGEIATLSGQYASAEVSLQSALAAENALRASLASVPATISTTSAVSTTPAVPQANPEYQSLSQQLNSSQVQLAVDQAKAQALYQQTLQHNYSLDPTGYQAAQQAYGQAQVVVAADQAGIAALQNELAQTPETLPVPPQAAPTVTVTANPQYTQIEQSLGSQEVTVAQDQAEVNAISTQIPPLQQQVASLESQDTSAQASVSTAQAKVAGLTTTFQTLETNITNAQISQALGGTGPAALVQAPAVAPGGPISPKKKTDVAVAFLLGLVVGAALAFILEQFDNTIKTAEDVRRVVGLPTLAAIPVVRS